MNEDIAEEEVDEFLIRSFYYHLNGQKTEQISKADLLLLPSLFLLRLEGPPTASILTDLKSILQLESDAHMESWDDAFVVVESEESLTATINRALLWFFGSLKSTSPDEWKSVRSSVNELLPEGSEQTGSSVAVGEQVMPDMSLVGVVLAILYVYIARNHQHLINAAALAIQLTWRMRFNKILNARNTIWSAYQSYKQKTAQRKREHCYVTIQRVFRKRRWWKSFLISRIISIQRLFRCYRYYRRPIGIRVDATRKLNQAARVVTRFIRRIARRKQLARQIEAKYEAEEQAKRLRCACVITRAVRHHFERRSRAAVLVARQRKLAASAIVRCARLFLSRRRRESFRTKVVQIQRWFRYRLCYASPLAVKVAQKQRMNNAARTIVKAMTRFSKRCQSIALWKQVHDLKCRRACRLIGHWYWNQVRERAAVRIQRRYRQYHIALLYAHRMSLVVTIQRFWRTKLTRARFLALREAAVVFQKRYKAIFAARELLRSTRNAEVVQRALKRHAAATKIQSAFRASQDRAVVRKWNEAATTIQQAYRTHHLNIFGKRLTDAQIAAVSKIQDWYRCMKCRQYFLERLDYERRRKMVRVVLAGVSTIQRWIRGFLCRKNLASLVSQYMHVRNQSAVVLQRSWRSVKEKRAVMEQKSKAIVALQGFARIISAKKKLHQLSVAANINRKKKEDLDAVKAACRAFVARRDNYALVTAEDQAEPTAIDLFKNPISLSTMNPEANLVVRQRSRSQVSYSHAVRARVLQTSSPRPSTRGSRYSSRPGTAYSVTSTTSALTVDVQRVTQYHFSSSGVPRNSAEEDARPQSVASSIQRKTTTIRTERQVVVTQQINIGTDEQPLLIETALESNNNGSAFRATDFASDKPISIAAKERMMDVMSRMKREHRERNPRASTANHTRLMNLLQGRLTFRDPDSAKVEELPEVPVYREPPRYIELDDDEEPLDVARSRMQSRNSVRSVHFNDWEEKLSLSPDSVPRSIEPSSRSSSPIRSDSPVSSLVTELAPDVPRLGYLVEEPGRSTSPQKPQHSPQQQKLNREVEQLAVHVRYSDSLTPRHKAAVMRALHVLHTPSPVGPGVSPTPPGTAPPSHRGPRRSRTQSRARPHTVMENRSPRTKAAQLSTTRSPRLRPLTVMNASPSSTSSPRFPQLTLSKVSVGVTRPQRPLAKTAPLRSAPNERIMTPEPPMYESAEEEPEIVVATASSVPSDTVFLTQVHNQHEELDHVSSEESLPTMHLMESPTLTAAKQSYIPSRSFSMPSIRPIHRPSQPRSPVVAPVAVPVAPVTPRVTPRVSINAQAMASPQSTKRLEQRPQTPLFIKQQRKVAEDSVKSQMLLEDQLQEEDMKKQRAFVDQLLQRASVIANENKLRAEKLANERKGFKFKPKTTPVPAASGPASKDSAFVRRSGILQEFLARENNRAADVKAREAATAALIRVKAQGPGHVKDNFVDELRRLENRSAATSVLQRPSYWL